MTSHERRILWGERFLRAFHRLIRTLRIHQDNNQMIAECLSHLVQAAGQLAEGGDLTIRVVRGRFYIQEERLLYRRENVQLIHDLLGFLEQRKLAGLRWRSPVQDVPPEEILAFVRFLNRAVEKEEPAEWLAQEMAEGRFAWVDMLQPADAVSEDEGPRRRQRARKTYAAALASIKDVGQKITAGGQAGVRKARRMVQSMVDLIMDDEAVLMGLTTIRHHDDYTYVHSVNVAVLAVCLGKRIGLSRASLEELGICGLFHDLGKVKVSPDILRKSGDLTDGEWKEIRRHPLTSVSQILKLRASRGLKAQILLAPFEHHQRYDLSGYPPVHTKVEMSLFGRILTIADVFDAMTSPRSYRPLAHGPDYALSLMVDGAGKEFDPVLLKVFIQMMGIYPVGTVLELDTGELGIVAESPRGVDRARPKVLILLRDGVLGLRRGEMVDLSEKDPATGYFRRNILRGLNPSSCKIEPARFLY